MVSLLAGLLALQQAPTPPPVLKTPILISGSKPSQDELNLVTARSRKEAKIKSDSIGVVVLESDSLVVYIAPSAAYPPSQMPFMIFELLGNKVFGQVNLKKVPKEMRGTFVNAMSDYFRLARVDPEKDDVYLGTQLQPVGFFTTGGTQQVHTVMNAAESDKNYAALTPCKGSLKGPAPDPDIESSLRSNENVVKFTTNPEVRRERLHQAIAEASGMYDQWFAKRWSKPEAAFLQELRSTLDRDPLLKGFPVSGTLDYGDLSPEVRNWMEDQLRRRWAADKMDPATVDKKMAALKFDFARLDFMLNFKVAGYSFPTGYSTQIWP